MGVFSENAIIGASNPTGYDIDQSLRFNRPDAQYLQRTFGASNRKTWTWSGWFKLADPSVADGSVGHRRFFGTNTGNSDSTTFELGLNQDNKLNATGWNNNFRTTTAVYRDPNQWYHCVWVFDSTDSTADDRLKLYVNGEQITSFTNSYTVTQDTDYGINQSGAHYVGYGGSGAGNAYCMDGYLAEIHFIDGQALTPASFGETNEDTNQWLPIKYAGSYGTNGFYQKYQDSSALGDDSSGNTNDFTTVSVAATDQVKDSPTNNFCTLNPLNLVTNTTLSEGNLKADCTTGNDGAALGTMSVSSGKWYWEVLQTTANANNDISMGVMELSRKMAPQGVGSDVYPNSYLYGNDGWNAKYNSTTSTINTYGAGDIIGWALDLDGNTLKIYKNNSLEYTYSSGVSGTFTPLAAVDGSSGQSVTHIANFGQDSSFNGEKTAQGNQDGNSIGDFYYTPPSGYLALCTDNLSDPSIDDPTAHFNMVTWTGSGSSPRSITGVGFQPDFLWIKDRVAANNHVLTDVVRGSSGLLYSNATTAEVTGAAQVSSYDSDGFTMGTTTYVNENGSSNTYVGWNWKAGGTASSNDDGTITSSVSANTTNGFSIITYTGNSTSGATIGHGLSTAPKFVMHKRRNAAVQWVVGTEPIGWNNYLTISTDVTNTSSSMWNDTAPSSSVITLGNDGATNFNTATYVCYAFAEVDGYSKVGSYTGNGSSDGVFIYTGFRPAWVMFKRTDSTGNWVMFDNKRDSTNYVGREIYADLSNAEGGAYDGLDFVSNGFKLRNTTAGFNASSGTFIYLAFAESPFKTANAR